MKSVGTIVEYNPFHNGHIYHLQQLRQKTNADVVIAVMSGNFVQRGEAAIIDKWERTKVALQNGIDLVIELPIYWAVQPAHLFAYGAVKLLNALKVNALAFGAEHADANFKKLTSVKLDAQKFKQFNQTYATLYNQQLEQQTGFSLNQSNDILAYFYILAQQKINPNLNLYPIQRKISRHTDSNLTDKSIVSASAIRNTLFAYSNDAEKLLRGKLPNNLLQLLMKQIDQVINTNWSCEMWTLLRHQLLVMSINQLQQIYQMSEGLEYRLKKSAEQNDTWNDFLESIKTKRYTYTRLQRVCLYTLLNITNKEIKQQQSYLRLLGFSERGRQYLQKYKKNFTLPLISRFDLHSDISLDLDYRAGKIYELLTGKEQDLRHKPIMYLN
ncbi:MAG: nucleotidyltransferase [Firmicutes bacterium]|uniref:tRNA(Met) cytidine acetate ligase n=1 Tax=Candidatus Gallilactobacillus intestinavium TaxID=2840838 RepID=A0A9D9E408_9LACO|nr:nucleotidyltransferase [Candidatus Gallilactobacillus intestinavium]